MCRTNMRAQPSANNCSLRITVEQVRPVAAASQREVTSGKGCTDVAATLPLNRTATVIPGDNWSEQGNMKFGLASGEFLRYPQGAF